jgi:hypothetical protein
MFLKMLFIINKVNGKVPDLPMLKGWVGPSSFPRIMSLKVVFQICFGSIKMMGTRGILVYQSGNPFMYQSRTPASSSTSIFLVICTHATVVLHSHGTFVSGNNTLSRKIMSYNY